MDQDITVLVIDDDQAICEILENELQLNGFEVYLAQDGKEGFRTAKSKKPDVILLDWMMPEQSGLEVLAMLKKHRSTKNIPVFMLTAKGKMSDIDRAFDIGVDDYITKPFALMEMAKIIKRKLQKVMDKRAELLHR